MSYEPNEKDGIEGVDRWTSNGYGLILNGEPVEPLEQDDIELIEETDNW